MFQKITLVLVCVIFAASCSATRKTAKHGPSRPGLSASSQESFFDLEEALDRQKQNEPAKGSLWTNSYASHLYNNMYRASQVGDSVMVVVAEESQGEGTGDSKGEKKVDHKASIDDLGGVIQKLTGLLAGFNPGNIIEAHTDSKFQGKGSTQRTNKLTARMSATVVKVFKNGNMGIRGEQHIKVNKEEQVLIVEGIIRPYDIFPDNTVLSSSVSEARISYSGFGIIADRQSPGWLVRVLDKVWPF